MQKVKLPRDVAEAIEKLGATPAGTECLFDIPYMIRCVETGLPDSYSFETIVKFYLQHNKNKALYFKAIANGWEVEETPEEKVRRYYEDYAEKVGTGKTVVLNVLHLLEITIPGVNDHGNS